jgi:periplasmic divalent cation tolerance protein
MKLIVVLTSTANVEEARRIAGALVDRKLAACVQISAIESVYTWEGAMQRDDEYRVLIKTTPERYPDVEAAILEMHSYDLPAIYALGLEQVYEPFGEWVAEQSRKVDD